jgi:hypothetical protein
MSTTRIVLALVSLTIAGSVLAGPVVPDFNASNFVPGAPIDNPYDPLVPGTLFTASAHTSDPDTGETGLERDEDLVTNNFLTINGVKARIVQSRVFLNNLLIEDTKDYFAQDKTGNVWYLGEDTAAFELDKNGKVIDTDTSGSFHAGVHGAKAGFIMPADPKVGFEYYQEFAPNDEALDQAKIVSLTETLTTPLGTFHNVLKTEETTVLEPGLSENKFYVKGIGQVLTLEDIGADGKALNTIPLVSVTTATAVPLPPAVWAGLFTVVLFTLPKLRRFPAR